MALALATGPMLFAVNAVEYIQNPVFPAKMAVIALAVANALVLAPAAVGGRSLTGLAGDRRPVLARATAAISIVGWLAAILLGRLIAYT